MARPTVGYIFNNLAGQRVHEANRKLAVERHEHERELAENAQAHERQLRHGDRAYEDRKATYRQVGNWALVTAQLITREGMELESRAGTKRQPSCWTPVLSRTKTCLVSSAR